jgi:hypothetical protein
LLPQRQNLKAEIVAGTKKGEAIGKQGESELAHEARRTYSTQ